MIVGLGLVKRDRDSFDWWFPQHLTQIMALVDHHYIRIDDDPSGITPFLKPYGDRITWEPQADTARFQEDLERNALLDYALQTDAEWAFCFDADEVLEDEGAQTVREWLHTDPPAACLSFQLHYCSHHRPGYILPVGGKAWRGFRLDDQARSYRYQADEDGLHCGTVPAYDRPEYRGLRNPKVIHYHATSCEEYMAERAFYDGTAEVRKHGGIDLLYACERFGNESDAFPLKDLAKDREDRFSRIRTERLDRGAP